MIDPDIRAFVDDSEAFFPADAATLPIVEQRRLYDRYAAAFAVARPADVRSEDGAIAMPDRTIPLRRFSPAGASCGTILYAHGGGFILGSLDSHDGITARIAAAAGADVVAVDYRLAPEHPAPAALDDVLAVATSILDGATPWADLPTRPLALMGDSAGGMLAASAGLRLGRNGHRPVAALGLFYPLLAYEPTEPARTDEAETTLTLADVHFYRDAYLAGAAPAPGTFVLDESDLGALPPTALLPAEHDPLRDDCMALARRLAALGIPHRLVPGTGLVHGCLRALDRSAVAARAFDQVLAFVADRLRGVS